MVEREEQEEELEEQEEQDDEVFLTDLDTNTRHRLTLRDMDFLPATL